MAKPALGRGLGALLGGSPPSGKPVAAPTKESSTPVEILPGERVLKVPVSQLQPCPFQPRKDFPEEALQELSNSIKEQGIVQPLIVRPRGGDRYEIIAGERRWRAAQMAGVAEVPVILREAGDEIVLELALVENLQRENLNPIEEALGFAELQGRFQLTQEEVATKVGKSRAAVANSLRLIRLPAEIQESLREGKLSAGHAKALAGLDNAHQQVALANRIIQQNLNVRQTEEAVQHLLEKAVNGKANGQDSPVPAARDIHAVDLENKLQERLGTKVNLRYRQGKGSVEIKFFTDEDLQRVMQIIGVEIS